MSKTKIAFTDLGLRRLSAPKSGQKMYWDQGCKGLALLLSPRGTKSFRVLFKLDGRYLATPIGRYGDGDGEVTLQWARGEANRIRALAQDGTDPRKGMMSPHARTLTFANAVQHYIEDYCKDHQRRWDQTERVLLNNCNA